MLHLRVLAVAGLALVALVALLFFMPGQTGEAGDFPPTSNVHYKCYDIFGQSAPLEVDVDLETQFGAEPNVFVVNAVFLCPPALKRFPPTAPPEGDLTAPHLKCYDIISFDDPPHIVDLTTQFSTETNVAVGQARFLCVPASKEVLFPEPQPPGPLLASPHYKCYDIFNATDPGLSVLVALETQFGTDSPVGVDIAELLCAPALKTFPAGGTGLPEGDLNAPHLKCYNIVSLEDPPHIVNIQTQFSFEPSVAVGPAHLLCVPVTKTVVFPTPTPIPTATPVPTTPPPTPCPDNDNDGWCDAVDNCVATATTWFVPAGDTDCDGSTTAVENYIGTDPNDSCANTVTPGDENPDDKWPIDFTDDQFVNSFDLIPYIGALNTVGPVRLDMAPSAGFINTFDLIPFIGNLNQPCLP